MPEGEAVAGPDLQLVEPESDASAAAQAAEGANPAQGEMPFAIVAGEGLTLPGLLPVAMRRGVQPCLFFWFQT